MNVEHKQSAAGGSFYINESGENAAEMEYDLKDKSTMVITHTYVDEALRGKKVGESLVKSGVDYARNNHMKVIPVCTFAKSIINRNDEMKDVL